MNSNANASEWIFGTKFLDEYIIGIQLFVYYQINIEYM